MGLEVRIKSDILKRARELAPELKKSINENEKMADDSLSDDDAFVGVLGELIFRDWLDGKWAAHRPALNHEVSDFREFGVEVKASSQSGCDNLHLLAKEYSFKKIHADHYVQVMVSPSRDLAWICGFTDRKAVAAREPTDRFTPRRKDGKRPYRNYWVPCKELKPIEDLRTIITRPNRS